MNGQARRSLVLCVATFLATLPGEPSQSQTTTAPAAENVQTELPPQAKRWLNIQLRNEARAKKIGAPYYDPFPILVCNGACGAINRDGTVAVPFAYDRVDQFSEGRALVRVRHRYSYLYGYCRRYRPCDRNASIYDRRLFQAWLRADRCRRKIRLDRPRRPSGPVASIRLCRSLHQGRVLGDGGKKHQPGQHRHRAVLSTA
jgi:hypothetical protein